MKKSKRFITIILAIMVMATYAAPAANAEEIPPYDYNSFQGKWDWDLSVPLAEDQSNWYTYDEAWVDISKISENKATLEFYHQKGGMHLYEYDKCEGTISGNTITATTHARKGNGPALAQFTLTLILGDNYIWLESYNNTENGVAFSGKFISKTAVPRKVETETENYSVILNGTKLEFDQPPVMYGDRILVPLRKIAEELGADVYYDSDVRMCETYITVKKDNLVLTLEKSYPYFNNIWRYDIFDNSYVRTDENFVWRESDVSPMIINNRTLVPLRLVSEALNADVQWNDTEQTVYITSNSTGNTRNDSAEADKFTFEKAQKMLGIENTSVFLTKDILCFPGFDAKGKYWLFYDKMNENTEYADLYKIYSDGTTEYVDTRKIEWRSKLGRVIS